MRVGLWNDLLCLCHIVLCRVHYTVLTRYSVPNKKGILDMICQLHLEFPPPLNLLKFKTAIRKDRMLRIFKACY